MKNKTFKNDLIVFVIILIIIGGLFLFKSKQQGSFIEITKNHEVYMIEATCPDKLCIKQGHIEKKGATIVCLPHHLVIEIKKGNEQKQDGKVY